ncbi:MAG: ABC transporter ATP-binding protein [Planctomycetota bacterium]
MKRLLATTRVKIAELRALNEQFGELVLKERRLLLYGFFALWGEVLFQLLLPWPTKYIFDGLLIPQEGRTLYGVPPGFPQEHPYIFLALACAALLTFSALVGLCSFYRTVWTATAGQRIVMKLRKRLYAHLHRLSLRFHQGSHLGDLLVRIVGDIPMLRDVLSGSLIELIGRLAAVMVTIAILFVLDPIVAGVSLGVLVTVASLSGLFARRIVKVAKKQREQEGILAYTAGETLTALAQVKALGREQEVVRRFARQNRSSLRKGLKATRLQAALSRWVELIFGAGVATVVAVGVFRILRGEGLSAGDLLIFVSYVRNLNKPLRKVTRISGRIGKAAACGQRILEIFDIEPEEIDLPGARPAPPLEGAITLEGVGFSYDGEVPALEGIHLRIAPGERVGIVGRNGAGKTTLMHLILRFYEPTAGAVTFDGIDSRQLTIESLRDQIIVALQGTYIFGSSVRDNLLFSAPDAGDDDMVAALDQVGGDFVMRLEGGLDTELAEGGTNLSGGERRKLALAGVILRHTPILILDEPTTHIDRSSRADLIRQLPQMTTGRTTLVITHDPEMLHWLDRVIYLEEGRIAAEGSHGELQQSSLGYRALFPSLSTGEEDVRS